MTKESFKRLFLSSLAIFAGIAILGMKGNSKPTKLAAEAANSNDVNIVFDFNDLDESGKSQNTNCLSYGLSSANWRSIEMQTYDPTYNYGFIEGKYYQLTSNTKNYTYLMKGDASSIFYNTENPYLENYYISKLEVIADPNSY